MKILFLGPQGSGKGTVGKIISKELGLPHIEVGKVLRDLPESHPRYKELHELMDAGHLAPQDFVAELLKNRVKESDCANGFIFDGWCRSMVDLTYFDPGFDIVIVLTISYETSKTRVTGRRMCDTDGKIYNIYTLPQEELAKCKGNLTQREDDTEEALKKRLEIYATNTQEVINHYKEKGILYEVSAEEMPDIVAENVLAVLKGNSK